MDLLMQQFDRWEGIPLRGETLGFTLLYSEVLNASVRVSIQGLVCQRIDLKLNKFERQFRGWVVVFILDFSSVMVWYIMMKLILFTDYIIVKQ